MSLMNFMLNAIIASVVHINLVLHLNVITLLKQICNCNFSIHFNLYILIIIINSNMNDLNGNKVAVHHAQHEMYQIQISVECLH